MFEQGKSGNPRGRPKGKKNKATYLKEVLEAHGVDAVQLALAVYKKAMEAADYSTAERVASNFVKYSYPMPQQTEQDGTAVKGGTFRIVHVGTEPPAE
jgi:hypothetical protein